MVKYEEVIIHMKFATETVSGVLGARIIVMETRRRALEELLIEKEIISKQEIEEKVRISWS